MGSPWGWISQSYVAEWTRTREDPARRLQHVICPSCGTESRPGAKFCAECATPLAVGCPSCGTQNGPVAKFCSECATPLAAAARPAAGTPAGPRMQPAAPSADAGAERRLVSVLFADLVGFTPF